jgi:hypothetical protein
MARRGAQTAAFLYARSERVALMNPPPRKLSFGQPLRYRYPVLTFVHRQFQDLLKLFDRHSAKKRL